MNGLDLFSGIGGITLALEPWSRPVAYCENDPYGQAVLLSRMRDGRIPTAPIWGDVQTLSGAELSAACPGGIDLIYGGFPCQDISCAGNGAGLAGKRSGLVFEIFRLIDEIRPAFVFLENVPAIRTRGAETVGKELARRGYDCRWTTISAAEVGAPHLRNRWWLLAHRDGRRFEGIAQSDVPTHAGSEVQSRDHVDGLRDAIPHPKRKRKRIRDESRGSGGAHGKSEAVARDDGEKESMAGGDGEGQSQLQGGARKTWEAGRGKLDPHGGWVVEPDVGRVVTRLPTRLDRTIRRERVKGLGNSVVPLQARTAFKRLMGIT